MKKALTLLCIGACLLLTAGCQDEQEEAINKKIDFDNEMASILEDVTDEDSADDAIEDLKELIKEKKEYIEEKMERRKELKEEYEEEMEEAEKALEEQQKRIEKDHPKLAEKIQKAMFEANKD